MSKRSGLASLQFLIDEIGLTLSMKEASHGVSRQFTEAAFEIANA